MIGLLLVVLWMLPVALGGQAHASRRLLAAWLAASGALGLVVSLAVLYRLQMRFGMLYLLAGMGSCLYLAGLFCGNRLGAAVLGFARGHQRGVPWMLFVFTLAQAGAAFAVLAGAEWTATATGVVLLCFVAGSVGGVAVPTALAACEGGCADGAAVFVLSDSLGAAVAGLFFVVLLPLAGVRDTIGYFVALVCGLALCAVLAGRHARLTAGLALVATLAGLGGRLRDAWPEQPPVFSKEASAEVPAPVNPVTNQTPGAEEKPAPQLRGIPRKVNEDRIREQMRDGRLSTHAASFWDDT